jgi:hypothetical protein
MVMPPVEDWEGNILLAENPMQTWTVCWKAATYHDTMTPCHTTFCCRDQQLTWLRNLSPTLSFHSRNIAFVVNSFCGVWTMWHRWCTRNSLLVRWTQEGQGHTRYEVVPLPVMKLWLNLRKMVQKIKLFNFTPYQFQTKFSSCIHGNCLHLSQV